MFKESRHVHVFYFSSKCFSLCYSWHCLTYHLALKHGLLEIPPIQFNDFPLKHHSTEDFPASHVCIPQMMFPCPIKNNANRNFHQTNNNVHFLWEHPFPLQKHRNFHRKNCAFPSPLRSWTMVRASLCKSTRNTSPESWVFTARVNSAKASVERMGVQHIKTGVFQTDLYSSNM